MSDEITITVNQAHEQDGNRWSGWTCPIALAIKDAAPGGLDALSVSVYGQTATVYGSDPDDDDVYRLPMEAVEYALRFDRGENPIEKDGGVERVFTMSRRVV